jgi:hypothetical protein
MGRSIRATSRMNPPWAQLPSQSLLQLVTLGAHICTRSGFGYVCMVDCYMSHWMEQGLLVHYHPLELLPCTWQTGSSREGLEIVCADLTLFLVRYIYYTLLENRNMKLLWMLNSEVSIIFCSFNDVESSRSRLCRKTEN